MCAEYDRDTRYTVLGDESRSWVVATSNPGESLIVRCHDELYFMGVTYKYNKRIYNRFMYFYNGPVMPVYKTDLKSHESNLADLFIILCNRPPFTLGRKMSECITEILSLVEHKHRYALNQFYDYNATIDREAQSIVCPYLGRFNILWFRLEPSRPIYMGDHRIDLSDNLKDYLFGYDHDDSIIIKNIILYQFRQFVSQNIVGSKVKRAN